MRLVRSSDIDDAPASHEDPMDPGVLKRVLIRAGDVREGRLRMVNWASMKPGKAFRPHFHEDMDEVFVMVGGRVRMTVDGETAVMGKGDAVVIPAGAVHCMENVGTDAAEYLALGVSGDEGGKTVVVNPTTRDRRDHG